MVVPNAEVPRQQYQSTEWYCCVHSNVSKELYRIENRVLASSSNTTDDCNILPNFGSDWCYSVQFEARFVGFVPVQHVLLRGYDNCLDLCTLQQERVERATQDRLTWPIALRYCTNKSMTMPAVSIWFWLCCQVVGQVVGRIVEGRSARMKKS